MGFCSPKKLLLCALISVALIWGVFMISSMESWGTKEQPDSKDSKNEQQIVVDVNKVVPQTEDEKAEERRGFERNGFNQYVSDRIPLDRAVPDTRDTR